MADPVVFTISDTPRGICDICGEQAYAPQAKKCDRHRGSRKKGGTVPRPDVGPNADAAAAAADSDFRVGRPGEDGDKEPGFTPILPDDKDARRKEIRRLILDTVNPNMAQGMALLCQPIPAVNFYKEDNGKVVPFHKGEAIVFEGWEATVLAYVAAEIEKAPHLQTAKAVVSPVLPILAAVAGGLVILMHGARIVQVREQLLTQWKDAQAASPAAQEAAARAASGAEQAAAQQESPGPAPADTPGPGPGAPSPNAGSNGYNPLRDPLRATVGDVGADKAEAQEDVTTLPDIGAIFDEELAEAAGT